MRSSIKIAVAMSGGLDSSVSAALLKRDGYEVFGLMLQLWSAGPEIRNRCCSPEDLSLAQQVADKLDIPFYALGAQDLFKRVVVDPFIDGYAHGITPNPCLSCNRQVRWGFLLDSALKLGATHMATGHYARVRESEGIFQLLRARDLRKDQSYILSVLTQQQLAHAVFPLASLEKSEVRSLARDFDLPIVDRRESQDLCFLGDMDYRNFLQDQGASLPPPGTIEDVEGNRLGDHQGLASFTIGQRKGIGIAADQPFFVIDKDTTHNRLIVGKRADLGRDEFLTEQLNWISGITPHDPFKALTRIRYKSREVQSTLYPLEDGRVRVRLEESLPDVTPGQAAVFYQEDLVLGGGIICQ